MTGYTQRAELRSGVYLLLMASTAIGFFGSASLVVAQETVASPQISSDEVVDLGEIIISARRIEERLDEAPVPVSVVTEDEIGTGKIDRLEDIAKTAPNVIGFDSNGVSFVIRGVGSQSIQGLGSEVGVGLFADEVYLGNPDAAPQFLNDLERTEVVRGSQATLYGRNTIGGAINLVSREPGSVPSAEIEASVGTDGYYRFRGAFDAPLSTDGRWLSRTFLSYTEQPDGITNVPTGQDDLGLSAFAGRFTLIGELTDRTNLKFTLDGEYVDDDGFGGWAPVDLALDHKSDLDFPGSKKDRRYGTMLRIDHDFDTMLFSSITAYRGFKQDLSLDGDFTSGPYAPAFGFFPLQQGRDQDQNQFTQEFRLTSANTGDLRAGELSWNAGLFFMHEDYDGFEFFELASVPSDQTSRSALDRTSETYAVYGNVTYQISDRIAATLGGRYTYESKEGDVEISSPSGTNFYGMPMRGSADVSFDNFSPEGSLDYRLNNGGLLYARIASGFKSGGISQFFNADGSVNTFDPETSVTYEIGLKTPVLNDRGWLEVNVFQIDWKDQQSNVFISDFQRVTANASSATSKGLELTFRTDVTDELTLGATYGYLDAKYDDFVYSFFSSTTGTIQTVDYSGNDIPLAPKHTASLVLDWQRPLNNGLTLVANGIYTYRSSYTFDPVGTYSQSPTHILDATIGVRDDNWEAYLWATNLLDEKYLSNYFLFGNEDFGIAAPGREVGVTFKRVW